MRNLLKLLSFYLENNLLLFAESKSVTVDGNVVLRTDSNKESKSIWIKRFRRLVDFLFLIAMVSFYARDASVNDSLLRTFKLHKYCM